MQDPRADQVDVSGGSAAADGGNPAAALTPPPAAGASPIGPLGWRQLLRRNAFTTILPIAGYLVLVFAGITTSNIGIGFLRADSSHPLGFMIGTPKGLRSDEWLTTGPMELGVIASGGTDSATPLAQEPDLILQIPTSGAVETVVFADGALLKLGPVLPDQWLFAGYRWLPFLLLVLFAPRWLQRLGARPNLAWLATALIILSPASMWWSYVPLRILAFALAGSYLVIHGVDRLRDRRLAAGLLSGAVGAILLARLPSYYVPWSLTLAVPVVLASVVFVLWPKTDRRIAVLAVGGFGALSLALFAGVLWDNRAALAAELNTVYPGQRRTTGSPMDPAQLFAAPGLGPLQRDPTMLSLNPSEISSSFTVLLVWAVLLWVANQRLAKDAGRAAMLTLGVSAAVWSLWALMSFGVLGTKLPLLNLVEPIRAAATVGFLGILLLALMLSRWPVQRSWRTPLIAGAVCFAVTVYGVSDLREHYIPVMSPFWVGASSLAVGVLVAVLTRWPDRWLPVVLTVLLAAVPVATVNPILLGLADLRDSPAAKYMLAAAAQARADGTRWASNTMMLDGLLSATGVPMISGHQVTGPVREEWLKVDPTGQYESVWNRGSAYVIIDFVDGPTTMEASSLDVIRLHLNPCSAGAAELGLAHLFSSDELSLTCLTPIGTLYYADKDEYIYAVGPR